MLVSPDEARVVCGSRTERNSAEQVDGFALRHRMRWYAGFRLAVPTVLFGSAGLLVNPASTWKRTSRWSAEVCMRDEHGRHLLRYYPLTCAFSEFVDPTYDDFDWSLDDYFLWLHQFAVGDRAGTTDPP